MNLKKQYSDLKLLSLYMDYWIDRYPKQRISFNHFKVKAEKKRQNDIKIEMQNSLKRKCFYCQQHTNGEQTIDHIVPVSRGGRNVAENKVYSCERCNNIKADHLLSAFQRFLEKELKKPSRRGEMYNLDKKTVQIMISNVKKLIKIKQPIIHKISEYESMI